MSQSAESFSALLKTIVSQKIMPRNILLTHPDTGETKSLTDWAKTLGISYTGLRNRYRNYPNDIRKVLSPYYLDETEGKTIAQRNKEIAEFEEHYRQEARQEYELIQQRYQQKLMRNSRWVDDILVYQEEPELKLEELIALANRYGYDLVDVSQQYPYNQRKRPTWALVDRRTKAYACVYSTKQDIKKFLDKLGS